VNTQYLSFISKLKAIAYAPDTQVGDRNMVMKLKEELNAQADELLKGLQESSKEARDKVTNQAAMNIMFSVVIIVITVIVILCEYRFVFLPMISPLVTEEDGTRLMLNMIPVEVRESVPKIAEYFSTGTVSDEDKIKKQLQASEKLLQNILPPAIARRLKNGERLIADDYKSLTVAFCACVGLDDITKGMKAKEIVAFLNDLVIRFDEIMERLDLEKIKTIGDVYFMCGGLTEKTAGDHALRVVDTVLKFFEALEQHKVRHNTPTLTMKAGINTGPAVAGVIGSRKVAYDLWGDAVNVSSRLAGTGLPGKVAVTTSTRSMVSAYFSFRERKVIAKGKGEMTTHILVDRTQPTPFSWQGA